MNELGEKTIASPHLESPPPQSNTTFPAEDLAELIGRLQKRNLELEAQNLDFAVEKSPGTFTERQFDQVFGAAPLGCVILGHQGTMLHINEAGAALFGADPPTLNGKLFREFVAGEDADKLQARLQGLNGRESFSIEIRLDPPDREPLVLQVLGKLLLPNTGERRFLLLLANVTPIKQARSTILRLGTFPNYHHHPGLYQPPALPTRIAT
jgi:PAS domain S-box-containing protein